MIGKAELFNLTHMRSGSHTEAKKHKIKERERPYQEFYFKGKWVCRKTFCFIHNLEKIMCCQSPDHYPGMAFHTGFMRVLENFQSMHFNMQTRKGLLKLSF